MLGARQRESFERIAMPYMDAVFQFALSLSHDSALSEDLVQESYLKAWRSFGKFEIGTNCKAWLFRICKNLFIDVYRQRARRPLHQDVQLAEPAVTDEPLEVKAFGRYSIDNEDIFLDMFGDEVNKFLRELPDDFRQALLLCDLDGLAYDEIAMVLEIPIGTVRSRISRARSFLRQRLEEYARDLGYSKSSTDGDAA